MHRKLEHYHNLIAQAHPNPQENVECACDFAMLIARTVNEIQERVSAQGAMSFAQQHMLKKGLQKFGEKGAAASTKEMDQLHRRNCFAPTSMQAMRANERKKAMEALVFLTEKRDGATKVQCVCNGKETRKWLTREDSASPTAAHESTMLTAVVNANEDCNVMCVDVPNAFLQTEMPEFKDGKKRVIVKIAGVLVDMLVQLNPELHGPHVVCEKNRKVLCMQALHAICGMLQASPLWHKKF